MDIKELRDAVDAMMPEVQSDLERLVRIPSVSLPGFPPEPLRELAGAVAELLTSVGCENVCLMDMPDGYPTVLGETAGPPGAPSVLLYAHYDVQPPGAEEEWTSPPFEPAPRDGRLYGRGTADDKSGVVMHAAAMRAMREAYGKESVLMGQGGSIPLISNLASVAPQAEIILWGAEDTAAAIHSNDESVDLAELQRCILAEALLLQYLSER